MSYSQSDLDAVRAAKLALAKGERIGEFVYNNRRIKYADCTMSELNKYEAEVLKAMSPRPLRYSVISTGKGL